MGPKMAAMLLLVARARPTALIGLAKKGGPSVVAKAQDIGVAGQV